MDDKLFPKIAFNKGKKKVEAFALKMKIVSILVLRCKEKKKILEPSFKQFSR